MRNPSTDGQHDVVNISYDIERIIKLCKQLKQKKGAAFITKQHPFTLPNLKQFIF